MPEASRADLECVTMATTGRGDRRSRCASACSMRICLRPCPPRLHSAFTSSAMASHQRCWTRYGFLATFANPEFLERQAMRLSTALTPRVIACFEDFGRYLALPRGCLPGVRSLFADLEIKFAVTDERSEGRVIGATFTGAAAAIRHPRSSRGRGHPRRPMPSGDPGWQRSISTGGGRDYHLGRDRERATAGAGAWTL